MNINQFCVFQDILQVSNFKECTPKVKAATYNMMVRPTVEYAATVWDPHKEKDKTLLEAVQRRAARYVNNNYSEREPGTVTNMLRNLGWNSLEERRKNSRLSMLYKIENDLIGIEKSNFFKPTDARTRGNNLYHEPIFHPAMFHSFFPRTISDWNQLPTATTSAPTLESFMTRLRGSSPQGVLPPAPLP